MDRTRYVELTRRQEADAAASPRAYRARAVLLALGGYGFLFGIMFLVTVFVTTILRVVKGVHLFDSWTAQLLLALAPILLTLLQLPREPEAAPEGFVLERADAPERSHLRARDRFVAHVLDADVRAVVEQLAGRKHLRRAYLVQRVVEHFPEDRAHVLVLESRLRWWWMVPDLFQARICAGLLGGLRLPDGVRAFAPRSEEVGTFQMMRKVPGAEVWAQA